MVLGPAARNRIRESRRGGARAVIVAAAVALFMWVVALLAGAGAAAAVPSSGSSLPANTVAAPAGPSTPALPNAPQGPAGDSTTPNVSVQVGSKPSQSVSLLLLITVLAVAPSLLLLVTSFTKIFVVLSLTRNALGLTSVPPNQVLAGLSLFLSMFVMAPVISKVNSLGIQPYLHGTKSRGQAWADGVEPLRQFMLGHTRPQEIALMLRAADQPNPADHAHLALTTLIPAFVLSELRSAMIIGFVIYVPFVIIDLVVSSSLMSLGMMMLPPVSVALPFKLLLFVLVDGWGLVVTALVQSYRGG